jgi:hypothetical protein
MSDAKSRNPYQRGLYQAGFAFMQKKQVVTRSQLIAFYLEQVNKAGEKIGESAAMASATVLLSPREKDSERGDCRGNFSARGEFYFLVPLKKVKGEERKFRLQYRKDVLARRVYDRSVKAVKSKEVKQVKAVAKTVKTVKTVKAPAKKAVKAVKSVKKTKTVKAVEAVETPVAPAVETVEAPAVAVAVETPAVAPMATVVE